MIIYIISTIWLLGGIYSAVFILLDLAHNPQKMKIMNTVWVLTGLWASFLSLPVYIGFGRTKPMKMSNEEMADMSKSSMADMKDMDMSDSMGEGVKTEQPTMVGMKMKMHPMWQSVFLSALHCGAGCTLADIVGESIGYVLRINISEWSIYWQWGLDYILALMFGLIFQYSAIRQMTNIGFAKGIKQALKVDFFSLTSWQIGMYAFMFFIVKYLYPFSVYSNVIFFGFIMQLAMLAGFVLAYPVNWLLIKLKVKPGM